MNGSQWLDATAQADLVHRGDASPSELVEQAIERIERLDPSLNAVPVRCFDHARATTPADGPFRGVPMLLKDMGGIAAGLPYHGGSRFLHGAGHVERRDSHYAAKLRDAGFVFLGRTNVPECALAAITEPSLYGPCRNPWDTDRTPGGSSGGAAAAVASGMVAVAHANDGGGSIRVPASYCGLIGLKPSRGRVSNGPFAGEFWGGLAVEHVLTRTVRDTAALLDVLSGPMPGDPYTAPPPARPFAHEAAADPGRLRVGLCTTGPAPLDADTAEAVRAAGRLLESLGHDVAESHPEPLIAEYQRVLVPFARVVGTATASMIAEWETLTGRTADRERDLEPNTRFYVSLADELTGADYHAAVEQLHAYTRRFAAWWAGGFDVLVTPTCGKMPWRIGEYPADPAQLTPDLLAGATAQTCFTFVYNVSGQPAVSLPLHTSPDGMPVGVMFGAAYGREDLLLRLAAQLEAAAPWADRHPPLH